MKRTYRIRNWDADFETADTRKLRSKSISWVRTPNKHDGKGYRRVAQSPDAVEVFCAWGLILQVASKMPTRGTLADEDGPLDADDLAAMTGFPASNFDKAFALLVEPRIAWLEVVEADETGVERTQPTLFRQLAGEIPTSPETSRDLPDSPETSRDPPTSPDTSRKFSLNRMEGNGRERTHTHVEAQPRARARDGPEAPSARVCVDELTFEDFEGYARSEPGFHNPRGWAMKALPKRDPNVLKLVAAWKAKRDMILEGKPPPEAHGTPFHVAAQAVASVAQVPGYDVAAYIEQMQDVSEDVREKLRVKFCPQQAASAG